MRFAPSSYCAVLISVSVWLLSILPAHAQTYPSKPVRLIVPWAPGGTSDILARIVAQKMTEGSGQPVLVDNRPGANGQIGTAIAVKSPSDGYTLLLATTAPNSTAPSLFARLPYDPIRDFTPISLIATTCYVMSVHPALAARSVREFVKLAKARPGELNFASPGTGTPNHLSGEMFKARAGIQMQHIPYKGSAPAIADVIGGQVPLTFENIAVVLPHIRSGKVRALAITSAERSAHLREVPTVAESGFPGFEAVGWFGLMAPPGMAREITTKLSAETARILSLPDVQSRVSGLGAEIRPSNPEELDRFNRHEIAKWAKVIKDAGIQAE